MKQFFFACAFLLTQLSFSQAEPLETTPLPNAKKVKIDSLQIDEYADEKNGLKSLILPGWGQFENDQKVKGGIFFALAAGGIYTSLQNRKDFKVFDDAYGIRLQTNDDPQDEFAGILSLNEIYNERQSRRSNKDIAVGATAYLILINAFDAAAQYKIIRQDPEKHSATKAAYYSAILPGLGQAYNKKYWKIPLVYAAMGTSLYIALDNRTTHREYLKELEFRAAGESPEFRPTFSDQNLQDGLEYWRKWRDFAYVATGAVYLLNILDATVDAHLYDFNVDEDLAFTPSPVVDQINGNFYYGINLTFQFANKE